jgi:hypothetical protein
MVGGLFSGAAAGLVKGLGPLGLLAIAVGLYFVFGGKGAAD